MNKSLIKLLIVAGSVQLLFFITKLTGILCVNWSWVFTPVWLVVGVYLAIIAIAFLAMFRTGGR